MRDRKRIRRMTVELLEDKRLLASSADIIFLIDESDSQASTGNGNAVRPWVSHIVPELEEKLISRGDRQY